MNKNKIVLFDIDHTLFDATLYRDRMFGIIERYLQHEDHERVRKLLETHYVTHRKKIGYFDIQFMLNEVIKELEIDADTMSIFNAIIEDESSYKEALFEETIEVLEMLAKHKGLTLGIFSSGRPEHQLRKVALFRHVFSREHIHISTGKEKDLPGVIAKYSKTKDELYLIDDILSLLQNAKNLKQDMRTVWMKRGHYAQKQQESLDFKPDFSIYNLREVIPILI